MKKISSKSDLDKILKRPVNFNNIKEVSQNRDVREEFNIKKGLINLTKRLYREDYKNEKSWEKYGLPIIKRIQEFAEPYQPKTIKLNNDSLIGTEQSFKVGNVKERINFEFGEILNIFNDLNQRISYLENIPNKRAENLNIEKENKKYLDNISVKNMLIDELKIFNTGLDFYNNIKEFLPNKNKGINEGTKIERIFRRLLEDFR
jgi:hypothetical protein